MRLESDDDAPADLGEMEGEEHSTFPGRASRGDAAFDLSVQTLIEQWGDKALILPNIQREYVWDNGKASRLIESLVLNIRFQRYISREPGREIRRSLMVTACSVYCPLMNKRVSSLSGIAVLREIQSLFSSAPGTGATLLKMRTLRTNLDFD